MEDEAADDKQTVTRSLKLSCGSSARSVATTTTVGSTQQHFVAVCGGSRVVLAQLNELAIEVNGDIVLDRALTDGSKPWVSACAVAFCSGIRLVVGGELAEAQGVVAIFDCSNGNPLSTHRARAPVLSLSVSADGKTMAVGEKSPTLLLGDLPKTMARIRRLVREHPHDRELQRLLHHLVLGRGVHVERAKPSPLRRA